LQKESSVHLFARTLNATKGRRIKLEPFWIYRLSALVTQAKIASVNSLQSRADFELHCLASVASGLCHSLSLHRVHSRKSPYFGLIEFHNGGGLT
jgi:hypothetical protein